MYAPAAMRRNCTTLVVRMGSCCACAYDRESGMNNRAIVNSSGNCVSNAEVDRRAAARVWYALHWGRSAWFVCLQGVTTRTAWPERLGGPPRRRDAEALGVPRTSGFGTRDLQRRRNARAGSVKLLWFARCTAMFYSPPRPAFTSLRAAPRCAQEPPWLP